MEEKEKEKVDEKQLEEQRKMLEAQILQQQMLEIENQLNQIEMKKQELLAVIDSIDSLKDSKGAEIKVPLGTGVLVNAKLEDTGEFLVNVGSNVVVNKTAEQTKKLVKEQIKELDKAKELFEKEMDKIIGR